MQAATNQCQEVTAADRCNERSDKAQVNERLAGWHIHVHERQGLLRVEDKTKTNAEIQCSCDKRKKTGDFDDGHSGARQKPVGAG